MLEDVRKSVRGIMEAGMAAVSGALTPSRARDLASSVAGGQGMDQVNRLAQDLLEWSQRSREWITEAVQREVKRQLSTLGIATREDVDALRKRVRELERATGTTKRTTAKKSTAKRAAGKPPTAAAGPGDPAGPAT